MFDDCSCLFCVTFCFVIPELICEMLLLKSCTLYVNLNLGVLLNLIAATFLLILNLNRTLVLPRILACNCPKEECLYSLASENCSLRENYVYSLFDI